MDTVVLDRDTAQADDALWERHGDLYARLRGKIAPEEWALHLPWIDAITELKRERNAVIVSTEGVHELTLYLYDEFLNLNAEILLVVNGQERRVTVKRELRVLARTAAEFAGTGEVYTAAVVITP